jgi:hypothetical protein
MFLFYFWPSIVLGLLCCAICLWVWLFWMVRSQRFLIRVAVRVGSLFLVSISLFVGLLVSWASFSENSVPIYSPDHGYAIGVHGIDEGAVGGATEVTLYSLHGLRGDPIFLGEWGAVKAEDIHWITNDSVLVSYHHPSQPPRICISARGVTVHCEQALEPVR